MGLEVCSLALASCVTLCSSLHVSGLGSKSLTMLPTSQSQSGQSADLAPSQAQGEQP